MMSSVRMRDAAPLTDCFFMPQPPLTHFLHRDGDSPLHLAALNGDLAVAKLLVAAGADVNMRDG
jgi:hypothetical protein